MNNKYQGERDREIRKMEIAISKLQIQIHKKKHDLVKLRQGSETMITRWGAKIQLKKQQIADLERRAQPRTAITKDTSTNGDEPQDRSQDSNHTEQPDPSRAEYPDANQMEQSDLDIDNELLVTIHGLVKTHGPPRCNLKKLVVWQIERHIQWASLDKQRPWTSTSDLCSILDIRTAAELEGDSPMGQGNLHLNSKYCRLPLHGTPWGKPAAALMDHANKVLEDPEEWLILDEPRALLIGVENWYFLSPPATRGLFLGNEDDKWVLPVSIQKKWDQAFAIGSQDLGTGQEDASSE